MFRSKFPRKVDGKSIYGMVPVWISRPIQVFHVRFLSTYMGLSSERWDFLIKPLDPLTLCCQHHQSPLTHHRKLVSKEKVRERGRINTTEAFIAVTRYIRVWAYVWRGVPGKLIHFVCPTTANQSTWNGMGQLKNASSEWMLKERLLLSVTDGHIFITSPCHTGLGMSTSEWLTLIVLFPQRQWRRP